jgi:hypothetical protein
MSNLTTRVIESNIRIDEPAFFAFARQVKGRHTGWLHGIGRAQAKGEIRKFSFAKIFKGEKVVGYESAPQLHVVLKAIEAHMIRSKISSFGRVQMFGEGDDLPRHILLDYFGGTLSFTYPQWHRLDLNSVALEVPPSKSKVESVEIGIAYGFVTPQPKSKQAPKINPDALFAGVAGSTLYVARPKWTRRPGCTEVYASRAEALLALTAWYNSQLAAGYVFSGRSPLVELRRDAKGKFPSISLG